MSGPLDVSSMTLSSMSLQHPTVEEGLVAEETLLDMVCQGEASLGWLAWSPVDRALVMPRRHQRLAGFPDARDRLRQAGWPIQFRGTGGTPVPQGPAVVNLALAVRCRVGSSAAHLEWGYHRLGDPWCDWLGALGVADADLGPAPGAYCDGRFNVRLKGRKLVGTAQRWRRVRGCRDMALLVHGAMQVDDTPAALVAVVNAFQAAIDDPQRFQAASHIALRDALPDLDVESAIPDLLERLVAEEGVAPA
ncbi:lipoyl protein ligase domain-containing protein [Halomonas sp. M4R1S46]|uniref:lipoyl protein ligase domain-containing protein n=1 Tax=Halomonas sp. M4R1S46 TaxID=2982692 RepID=UPI0021E512E8|nr:lipoate--protein ligase family protein [Halomonas sp. M4R1S46]UYG09133.1 lipoate--protein ligase family protein [Halomonas sp. M4R1S46]